MALGLEPYSLLATRYSLFKAAGGGMGKSVHGVVLAACGLAAASVLVWPMPSMAQQVDSAALTECLIAKTAQSHIDAMKRLMISALQDDTEKLKSEAASYGSMIVQLAIDNCNITASQLTDPAVDDAVARYGEKIGEKIMTDAFTRIQ
jgi:hypothetical protein